MIGIYMAVGILSGIGAGVFGIGGGVVIVPALTLLAGFSQEMAVGTSLAVLLPPVGFWAAAEYYRQGNVDVKAALVIAPLLFLGAWIGARLAHVLGGYGMKVAFGVFLILLGSWIVWNTLKGSSIQGL